MPADHPILEFDPCPTAILEPHRFDLGESLPAKAVVCFFNDLLERLRHEGQLVQVSELRSEMGSNPLYTLQSEGQTLLVFHPGVGAPLAAGFLEEVIARGVRQVIACGGCGVLQRDIAVGHPVVLTSAVRDEGTSYHYLPPSREVSAGPHATRALEHVMQKHHMPYRLGKSWTTDAIYRETIARRDQRVAEGCMVVEMEASAFFAVASFRGIELGQVVYGGDLVCPEGWDQRSWNDRHDDRERLFWLSVEACLML